ncbi:myrosinase 1-like [Bombyx mandarina]|uniref:Myrosinase 1-like n=1 Tax=Bombyx mandarina TaxID=7092 RepID=A0A6J2JK49_BOMMA|nr:myrosinase 1-like [Bombyx mandarina]
MMLLFLLAVYSPLVYANAPVRRPLEKTFPLNFKFGAGSSSYQIEGAWNVSDKGESIQDRYAHEHPEKVVDGSNGDVACDSYNLWRRDIEMATELGLDHYRFSISWPRLLPSGYPNYISEDGRNYYNNLIDGLLKNNIEPVVTIYHYELPQVFQDLGGWTNPLIVDWFADYASVVYSLFADRVKIWLTVNEPLIICDVSYIGISAPGLYSPDHGLFLCNKHVLLAHAKAWRLYDEEYKPKYHGMVSLTQLFFWFEPETEADTELAELTNEYCEGRFAYPIYSKEGGWPPSLKNILDENSYNKGFNNTRVLQFTPEEIEFVKGTYDFYALNHYTSFVVKAIEPNEAAGDWPFSGSSELGVNFGPHPTWEVSAGFGIYPPGLRRQLNWLKNRYGDIQFMITETGYASYQIHGLNDDGRINFIKDYLNEVLLAIYEDKINVTGYTVWSLMDSYEWASGYTAKYGLYQVDFESPNKTRTPRKSAKYYADLIKNRALL